MTDLTKLRDELRGLRRSSHARVIDSLAKLSFFDKLRNICNFYPPKALASIPNVAQMTILRD